MASNVGGNIMPDAGPSAAPTAQVEIAQPTTGAKKKDPPKDLEISPLPTIEDILAAIPPEGVELKDLNTKFSTYINETNILLFAQIVQELGVVETKIWVKPSPRSPNLARIEELMKDATKPPAPRDVLKRNQSVVSKFKSGVKIIFSDPEELLRIDASILPQRFYRVDYEESATPSAYTPKHNHVKHRAKDPKLHEKNAFQSIQKFNAKTDLSCRRIERHLNWNKKEDPSSYISAFGDRDNAEKRAAYLAHESGQAHIGQRIIVAVIETQDLVPVTIRGVLRETIVTTKNKQESFGKTIEREVHIPAWVHKIAMPDDQSPISLKQLSKSGADMWLSIRELRHSNLKVSATKCHWSEWLACGVIAKQRVSKVWPYDGNTIHESPSEHPVRSKNSTKNWVFDWDRQMWMLEAEEARKRKQGSEDTDNNDGDSETAQDKRRRSACPQQDEDSTENQGPHCRTCTCSTSASSSTPDYKSEV